MALNRLGSGESKLETGISYLLIIGVVASLILEVIGVVFFYRTYGHLNVLLEDRSMFLQGQNFFNFLYQVFSWKYSQNSAILFMTMGTTVLILTPYLMIIVSVIYFTWEKDVKYALITGFVLAVITVSLVLH